MSVRENLNTRERVAAIIYGAITSGEEITPLDVADLVLREMREPANDVGGILNKWDAGWSIWYDAIDTAMGKIDA